MLFPLRFESPIHVPKISVFGDVTLKIEEHIVQTPKGTSLRGTTRFVPSLVQIWCIVRPVALAKKTKKEIKKMVFYSIPVVVFSVPLDTL